MFRRTRIVVAAAVLTAVAALATATPSTPLLDGLRADLTARRAALSGQIDPLSRIRSAVLKAALKNIDRDRTRSIADDLKILGKVAAKVEAAYATNDPALVTSLNGFLTRTQTDLTALDTEVTGAMVPGVHKAASTHAAAAREAYGQAAAPAAGKNTVKLRAAALRTAQTKIAAARRKLAGDRCHGYGAVALTIVGTETRFPWAYSELSVTTAGDHVGFFVQAFFYDRARPDDLYHEGALSMYTRRAIVVAPGTFTVGVGDVDLDLWYVVEGTNFYATSGSLTLTAADPALGTYEGTLDVTLVEATDPGNSRNATGRFQICKSDRRVVTVE